MRKPFFRETSGTALIEAAVALPVVVVIMLGVYDFGRAYQTLSTSQRALRSAVRYLTMLPSGLVCSSTGVTRAKNIALYGTTNAGTAGTEAVKGWSASNLQLDLPTSCSATSPVTVIRMSATVPYAPFLWGGNGFPASITMNIRHEERWIGQ